MSQEDYDKIKPSSVETIEVTKKEYEELLKEVEFLRALEYAGVDNWVGYEEAQKIYESWNE